MGAIRSDYWNEDEWEATVIGRPPGQTYDFIVVKVPDSVGYEVKTRGASGPTIIPEELKGWFTKFGSAEKAVRGYLNKLYGQIEQKISEDQQKRYVPKNAKTATKEAAS